MSSRSASSCAIEFSVLHLHIDEYTCVHTYIRSHVNMYYIFQTIRHTFYPTKYCINCSYMLWPGSVRMTLKHPRFLHLLEGQKQGLIVPYISSQ